MLTHLCKAQTHALGKLNDARLELSNSYFEGCVHTAFFYVMILTTIAIVTFVSLLYFFHCFALFAIKKSKAHTHIHTSGKNKLRYPLCSGDDPKERLQTDRS